MNRQRKCKNRSIEIYQTYQTTLALFLMIHLQVLSLSLYLCVVYMCVFVYISLCFSLTFSDDSSPPSLYIYLSLSTHPFSLVFLTRFFQSWACAMSVYISLMKCTDIITNYSIRTGFCICLINIYKPSRDINMNQQIQHYN